MKCDCGRNPVVTFVNEGKKKTVLKPKCRRCLVKWIYGSQRAYYRERKERSLIQYDESIETTQRSKPGITVWTRLSSLQPLKSSDGGF